MFRVPKKFIDYIIFFTDVNVLTELAGLTMKHPVEDPRSPCMFPKLMVNLLLQPGLYVRVLRQ